MPPVIFSLEKLSLQPKLTVLDWSMKLFCWDSGRESLELAALIADQAPLAVQATLQNSRSLCAVEKEALSQLPKELAALLSSQDFQAGVAAFATRSKPEFTGK
jgi:hypothetical protein